MCSRPVFPDKVYAGSCKYLSVVHRETPRARIEKGVERLQKMASHGGKVSRDSKMLIRNNFGRFVAAHVMALFDLLLTPLRYAPLCSGPHTRMMYAVEWNYVMEALNGVGCSG